jgi:hypothetical protein
MPARLRPSLDCATLTALLVLPRAQAVAERAVNPGTGHAYLRTEEPLCVFDAEALARALGGTLVAVTSAEEETFLLESFGAEPYWIGLEFPREHWVTGEKVESLRWSQGEPSGAANEPFTLLSQGEPGAIGDASGDVDAQRFRALIELPRGLPQGPLPPVPEVRRANRGVLLALVQGLTRKDLESPRLARLHGLWKGSAWTADAGADEGGDPLAELGMLLWGVGPSKSLLSSASPARAARATNESLLARLERWHPSVTTAALLDDPSIAGILLDGRTDVRVSDASPRKGGSLSPMRDALARATPLCVVAAWTDLGGGEPPSEAERAKGMAVIDQELGALLECLRARPGYATEEWWIALAGVGSAGERGGKQRTEDPRARSAVPLVLAGSGAPPGELLGEIGLVDLLPTALAHLGIEPRRSFGLDGRALDLARAPVFGEDLVVNGGAEAQFGWGPAAFPLVTGWRQLGGFALARHSSLAREGDPSSRGQGYFRAASGPHARLEQTIDLRALAADVDRGAVRFRLEGWLGLERRAQASIELQLQLLSEARRTLASASLGPVGEDERGEPFRAGGDGAFGSLLRLEAAGRVPRRTRAARLVLLARGPEVERAMADELSLVLEHE